MDAALDTPSPAPPPVVAESTPAPDVGNVVQEAPAKVVDAPRAPPITPTDSEVPIDLDHPPDRQPDLREVFPEQPQPEQREAQPQQPQEPQPQLEPLALPPEFAGEEEVWATLPRETQTAINGIVEHVKTKLQPQIEAATVASNAHHEGFWGTVAIHSQKARALVELARTNPQGLEQLARSPDGQKFVAEVGAESAAIQNHGRQIISQMQEAHRVESERRQQEFSAYSDQQDAAFRETAPEAADPEKWDAFQDATLSYLTDDIGVSKDTIEEIWSGRSKLTAGQVMRSAEFQRVLADAVRYRQGEARRQAAYAKLEQQQRERSRAQSRPLQPGMGGPVVQPGTLAQAAASGDMGTYLALRARGATR